MIDVITEALAKKFSKWVGKEIVICQDAKALAVVVAAGSNDKITYPIFALIQAKAPRVNYAGKTVMSAEGYATGGDANKIEYLRLVPITMAFSFVILHSTKSGCLDLWQQLITKAINNPTLEVDIPYSDHLNSIGENVKRTHVFSYHIVDEGENVGIAAPDQLLGGNIHGAEIGIEFKEAYIMFNRESKPVGIESIEVELKGDKAVEVELVWAKE